jgi:hypothetical protein
MMHLYILTRHTTHNIHIYTYTLKHEKVGLGSDICGGYALSVLDCMRQTVIASRTASFTDATTEPLT